MSISFENRLIRAKCGLLMRISRAKYGESRDSWEYRNRIFFLDKYENQKKKKKKKKKKYVFKNR